MKAPCPDHRVVLERRAPNRLVRAPSIAKVVPSRRRDETLQELARILRRELLVLRCADDWTRLHLRPGASRPEVRQATFLRREQLTTAALRDRDLPEQARTDAMEIVELLRSAKHRILGGRPRVNGRPARARAMTGGARLALRDGELDIARELLLEVVQRHPDDAEACTLLAMCIVRDPRSNERQLQGARRLLATARRCSPRLVEGLLREPPWSPARRARP